MNDRSVEFDPLAIPTLAVSAGALDRVDTAARIISGAMDRLAAAMAVTLSARAAFVWLSDGERAFLAGAHGYPAELVRWGTPEVIAAAAAAPAPSPAPARDGAPGPTGSAESTAGAEPTAYAGSALRIRGQRVGTVGVLTTGPREWSEADQTALSHFTELAEFLITVRLSTEAELDHERAAARAREDVQDAALQDYAVQVDEQDHVAELSRRLQNALLPRRPPPGDLIVDAFYQPGSQRLLLGGDFADTVRGDDGDLHFVMGDVTGHGPEAAALAISLRASWNALQGVGLDMDRITAELDRQTNPSGLFATMLLGRIGADGRLCLLTAGHPAPLLVSAGTAQELAVAGGPMLGLNLESPTWRFSEHQLADGELILYTDGLIEGHIGGGSERFEIDRLKEAIAVHGTDPATLCAIATAANGQALPDDVAILRIRARGSAVLSA